MKHTGKIYWFAQPAPESVLVRGRRDDDRFARLADSLHMLRDGAAAQLLITSLLSDHLTYGGVLFNFPPYVYDKPYPSETTKRFQPPKITGTMFSPTDLVVMSTRPPILAQKESSPDNGIPTQEECRRTVNITGAELENAIMDTLRHSMFEKCDREFVVLRSTLFTDSTGDTCDQEYRVVKFHQYENARVIRLGGDLENMGPADGWFTIGYVAYLPKLIGREGIVLPRLLCSFGLDGTATLLFAYHMQNNESDLLRHIERSNSTRLLMVRFRSDLHELNESKIMPLGLNDIAIKDVRMVNDLAC